MLVHPVYSFLFLPRFTIACFYDTAKALILAAHGPPYHECMRARTFQLKCILCQHHASCVHCKRPPSCIMLHCAACTTTASPRAAPCVNHAAHRARGQVPKMHMFSYALVLALKALHLPSTIATHVFAVLPSVLCNCSITERVPYQLPGIWETAIVRLTYILFYEDNMPAVCPVTALCLPTLLTSSLHLTISNILQTFGYTLISAPYCGLMVF